MSKAWSHLSRASGIKVERATDLSFLARRRLVLKTFVRKSRRSAEGSFAHFCQTHCREEARRFSAKLIKDIVRHEYWRSRQTDGVVLFDESVSQQFLLLCMRSNVSPELLVDSYVRLMPRMDVLVTLAVPEEVSLARIWQRNPHRPYFFGAKPREEALGLLRIANRARDLLMDAAQRQGIEVICCNGEAAPEHNARRIANLLAASQFDLPRAA